MSETYAVKEVHAPSISMQTPPLRLPDTVSTVEIVVAQAMEFCAKQMRLADAQAALERVKVGDPAACGYCHYSVAKQVAEALGALDQNIQAVYVFDYDATPQDLCFGEAAQTTPIHLLVWAERRTGALTSLVEALDRALAQKLLHLLGRGPQTHVLDVQIVDDAAVESRTGYGALLSSLHNRPIRVWER